MLKNQNKTAVRSVTGMFTTRDSAVRAFNVLKSRGYTVDDINLIMSDETREKYFPDDEDNREMGNKAGEGAGLGSAIGGTLGAIAGVVAALGTAVLIPGLGVVVAGPILAGLAGAGAGGITGGLIGALVGLGIPEEKARDYEEGIKKGHIVIGVHPRNQADAEYFKNTWHENSGESIHSSFE